MRAFIYWNLHKNCWSVRDMATRKVAFHTEACTLENATFKVSEAGRQRVLREKRKNVHAGVVGEVGGHLRFASAKKAYYNPYKQDCFTVAGRKVISAQLVMFHPDRTVTVLGETYA